MKQRLSVHKADKRNAAKLLQLKKKEDMMHVHRLFSGPHGVPKIVVCHIP